MQDKDETFEYVPMEATKITPRIVDVINKRVIGKMIILLCGNEGTEDDAYNVVLRRLLRHANSVIEVERKETLENAEFKFSDDKCNIYIVLSGKGENKFEFTYNGNLEPEVIIHRKTMLWTLFDGLRRKTFEVIPMEATTITPRIVVVINKRVIGKMITSLCGNEGTEDDAYNVVLRRLLRHAYSVIEVETKETLENAEFKFYDDKCNIYKVLSGKGENKFEFTYNEKLEPDVIIHRKTTLWTLFDSLRGKKIRLACHDRIHQVSSMTFEVIPMEATTISPRIVDVINKRVIGKMILSLCGSVATLDDAYTAVLRPLLQHAISVIGDETQSTLENAEFKFSDDKCNIYIVLSGNGENKFEFTYNKNLEPDVIIHRKTTLWTLFDSLGRKISEVIPREATTISPRIVDVIDKRVLGKMTISLCANEATLDDAYSAVLRRLLQHAISVIGEEKRSTLENAEFKFYDDKCDIYIVLSGRGENKFEFTYNKNLESEVIIHRETML